MQREEVNRIQEILRSRIKTPLVWGVLVITLGLSVLFYYSQNQQMIVYSRYVETLSDYKFLETRLMRSMEQVRIRGTNDSAAILSQLMSLRETAISVSASAEEFRNRREWMPPDNQFVLFEREVLIWISSVRQYLNVRTDWLIQAKALDKELAVLDSAVTQPIILALDSARGGYNVSLPDPSLLPSSLEEKVRKIFAANAEQVALWNRFDNDSALLRCEDIIQAFKLKSLDDLAMKFRVQQVFYLLSIVLLLFTLFFVFRSRK
jgi:hypothetical protein